MEIEFHRKWVFQREIRKSEKSSQIFWKENAHTGEKEKCIGTMDKDENKL